MYDDGESRYNGGARGRAREDWHARQRPCTVAGAVAPGGDRAAQARHFRRARGDPHESDRRPDVPITAMESRGVFTRDIEQALLDGEVDAAVHSLKDLPLRGRTRPGFGRDKSS
ncbi:MAG: hypothetical protein WKH64_04630 [Chloroflexia bacterium]